MDDRAQLEWEARAARPAAIAAFVAAALSLAALVYQSATLRVKAGKNTPAADTLNAIHQHASQYVVAAIIGGLATIALAGPLYYLYRAASARMPQMPGFVRQLSIAGPVAAGILGPIGALHQRDLANQFAHGVNHTEKHAKDLQSHLTGVVALGLVASLALAIAFIIVCLFAMRAGLFSKVMGIFGIAIGALTFLPGFSLFGSVVQIIWLPALGFLLLGRWPNGRGPAWETVEAIPWPSQAGGRGALGGAFGAKPAAEPQTPRPQPQPTAASAATPPAGGNGAAASPSRSRTAAKKRKRKRRG